MIRRSRRIHQYLKILGRAVSIDWYCVMVIQHYLFIYLALRLLKTVHYCCYYEFCHVFCYYGVGHMKYLVGWLGWGVNKISNIVVWFMKPVSQSGTALIIPFRQSTDKKTCNASRFWAVRSNL